LVIRDGLLVFRPPDRLVSVLPSVLAASGVRVVPRSVIVLEHGIQADAAPSVGSWWGERVWIRLRPDDGGTTVVELLSDHKGPSFLKDTENVARLRASFKRTMKTLGVIVARGRPTLG
jgi:hypothetical protein